ncbi:hypothetical protein Tco_0196073 [Tanacetum coccineum]
MTAIGRFLQGQSSQSHSSHHNFEINKEQFNPSNGVYGFSSSSNEGISGMYNKYEVSSAHCLPMDKMFAADHVGRLLRSGLKLQERAEWAHSALRQNDR